MRKADFPKRVLPSLLLCGALLPLPALATLSYISPAFTFNNHACSIGGQSITANTGGSLTQDGTAQTVIWAIQAIENGGAPVDIRRFTTTANQTVAIGADTLRYNNLRSHSTGDTFQVRLVCVGATPGGCESATIDPGMAGDTGTILANMSYDCGGGAAQAPVPLGGLGLLAGLSGLLAALGGGALTNRRRR